MLKVSLLTCIAASTLALTSAVYASQHASVFIENVTTGQPCTSMAAFKIRGENGGVSSRGSNYCLSERYYTIEANKNEIFDLMYFQVSSRYLAVEDSCKNQTIIVGPGKAKTIYIEGKPSNHINWETHIACRIVDGVPKY